MPSLSPIFTHSPYIGIFILLILGGIGFPFPEGATLIFCGILISTKILNPLYALVIAYAGVLTGDFLFYSLGRKYGRSIVTHRMFRRIISAKRLTALEDKFNKWGIIFILIGGRLIGEIFLVAGILKMPPVKFLLIDVISSLITIAIWVAIGYAGGHSLQVIQKDIGRIEHYAVLTIVILLAVFLIFRYFKTLYNKY